MTLLIRNVQLIDGTGAPPSSFDVFIQGERISAVGTFPHKRAHRVIDGQGAYLMPGFIDVHAVADHYLTLFRDPAQQSFLRQGITTAILGHCGISLAPLVYGDLEQFQRFTATHGINVHWHTVREFFAAQAKQRFGLNFATLAGARQVQYDILHSESRAITKNEFQVVSKVLEQALREGAAGISFDFGAIRSGRLSRAQLKSLADHCARHGKVAAFHLRPARAHISEDFEEILALAGETAAPLVISHFTPPPGEESHYEEMLERFEGLPPEASLYFEINPMQQGIRDLQAFLPDWLQEEPLQSVLAKLDDEWLRPKIMREMPHVVPDTLAVLHAPRHASLAGRSLRELQEHYGLRSATETLMQLMRATRLNATLLYRSGAQGFFEQAAASPRSLVATHATHTSDALEPADFTCAAATETFTSFLRSCVRRGTLPIERAVKKVTSTPARLFGLKDRGVIKEGNIADLVMVRNGTVDHVILSGTIALEAGVPSEPLRGTLVPVP